MSNIFSVHFLRKEIIFVVKLFSICHCRYQGNFIVSVDVMGA